MLKTDDSSISLMPITAKLELWTFQSLRLLDYFAQLLSWVFAAVVFLVFVIYGKRAGFSGCFVALTFMSAAFHVVREAVVTWDSYPSWIDVERHATEHREVSTPLAVSALILTFALFFRGRLGVSIFSLFLFIATNKFIVYSSQMKGEELFRTFRSFFEATAKGPDFVNSKSEQLVANLSGVTSWKDTWNENVPSELETTGSVLMRQTRIRTNGREEIKGEALIEFDADSDVAFLNISFCPPFESVPSFDFEQIDGEDASFKVSLLQPFGVRLETKRINAASELDEGGETSVKVAFYAAFPPMG